MIVMVQIFYGIAVGPAGNRSLFFHRISLFFPVSFNSCIWYMLIETTLSLKLYYTNNNLLTFYNNIFNIKKQHVIKVEEVRRGKEKRKEKKKKGKKKRREK